MSLFFSGLVWFAGARVLQTVEYRTCSFPKVSRVSFESPSTEERVVRVASEERACGTSTCQRSRERLRAFARRNAHIYGASRQYVSNTSVGSDYWVSRIGKLIIVVFDRSVSRCKASPTRRRPSLC